jgi:site-specific recombinase XerD
MLHFKCGNFPHGIPLIHLGGLSFFMMLSEAIEKFNRWAQYSRIRDLTVKNYDLVLCQFCLYMHDAQIEEVTEEHITSWFALQSKLGRKKATFIPKAIALRKFFNYWQKKGVSALDPWFIEIPRKEYNLPRVADDGQYSKLLDVIPTDTNDPRHIRNLAMIKMYWDSGARNGELCALDCDEVQPEPIVVPTDQESITLYRAVAKTEKSRGLKPFRELYWTEETNQTLKKWIEKREEIGGKMFKIDPCALFISCSGQKVGQRFTIKGVGEMLRHYSNRAGIATVNCHSFRHRKGHEIINSGGAQADVMNTLGHTSLASSSIYVQMHDMELARRVARVYANK